MAMHDPPHPGGIVRRQCLEPLGLKVTRAAERLGVTRQALSELLNGRTGVSVKMTIRLSKAFGSTPETWLGNSPPDSRDMSARTPPSAHLAHPDHVPPCSVIPREARARVDRLLSRAPAVVLTGPRQVGKTTLALEFARERNAAYLDLEDQRDRAKLADIHKYCDHNSHRLVILDEIHRVPGLEPLRGIIDQRRREGRRAGHFLLLGSASIDLLRQTGETLAGRVAYCEMQPLNIREAVGLDADDLWHRGGMPDSLLATNDADSFEWRFDFIRTYLERDIPALGPRPTHRVLARCRAAP